MSRVIVAATVCCITVAGQVFAQEVFIARDASAKKSPAKKVEAPAEGPVAKENFPKAVAVKQEPAKPVATSKPAATSKPTDPSHLVNVSPAKPAATLKPNDVVRPITVPPVKAAASSKPTETAQATKPPATSKSIDAAHLASVQPLKPKEPAPAAKLSAEQMLKAGEVAGLKAKKEAPPEQASAARLSSPPKKLELASVRAVDRSSQDRQSPNSAVVQPVVFSGETAFTKLADGFDFPIGKPDAQGYYKARGFRSNGHLGEDWDGTKGGDSDLGDAIYSIGDGLVVFARDCHMGWGNVVIVRHTYRENGTVKNIDALYGHLQTMLVRKGQAITRGQKIATMGNAHGLYDAHLHLEIRKNIEIGMSRAAFAKDFSNYYDPTSFINAHRHLQTGTGTYRVAMNTFVRDSKINFDKARNYSHARTGGGSRESSVALKKAVASQSSR